MDTFLYSFITYVHTYIHACMSTHTNYIIQTYYVCQYKHNYNLTYYCIIGGFRRKHEFSLFFFSFWWLSLELLLFMVSGQEIKRRALLSKLDRDQCMYVCMYVCICTYYIYLMASQCRLFTAPTSPKYCM
jgi:hypothetical protein